VRYPRFVAAAFGLAISACAVGPNFKPPTPPDAPGYGSASQSQTAAAESVDGATQRFVAGMDIPNE
jgi:hypothetical protein